MLAATIAGQGIAIGDNLRLPAPARHRRRLVRPFDFDPREPRYYFVTEHDRGGNPAIQAFADWLKARLVQTDGGAPSVGVPAHAHLAGIGVNYICSDRKILHLR